jgi:hypothetical protein
LRTEGCKRLEVGDKLFEILETTALEFSSSDVGRDR